MTNWRAIVAIESGVIFFIGVFGGIVVSQARSTSSREVVADHHRERLRQRNRRLMDIEIAQIMAPVTARIDRVDDAIATSHLDEAVSTWHDAYGEAVRTRRWEAMLVVGDAAARLAPHVADSSAQYANARRSYLAAFIRAREFDSVDGLTRTADAFARLGDTHVAGEIRSVVASLR